MKISFGLSEKEIQNAISQIKEYQSDLNSRCELFCERLCELGKITAEAKVSESPLAKYVTIHTDINPESMGCKAVLFALGEVKDTEYGSFNMMLAVEFGAGIHYNPVANPKADELGFGVGTYPGQIHAFEDGWFYPGEDGEWHYTHGVKATMPMYNASEQMILNIKKIAKECFKS